MFSTSFTNDELVILKEKINSVLALYGMECHSFLVGWYNSKVGSSFKLPYSDNTVAFLVISTPSMFEKAFLPFAKANDAAYIRDPLDECMKKTINEISPLLSDFDREIIHDFELTPSRRPKILMQTAGHVSGAARFYQRSDIEGNEPWDKGKKVFGVSIHPTYGGWFAFRAVVILRNAVCNEMKPTEPLKLINTDEDLANLLTLFNNHWRDGRYRDVIPTKEKYSELQKLYFDTLPCDRIKLLKTKFLDVCQKEKHSS